MRRGILLALVAVTAVVGTVSAQVAPAPIDYERASLLAGSCFNCHGAEGVAPAPGGIPSIAGMPAETMIRMMNAFKADEVPGATIMRRIALGFDDAEIAALARYFAGWNAGATP